MRTERIHLIVALVLGVLLPAVGVRAQRIEKDVPAPGQGLEVVEKLGEKVPLDLEIVDETGKPTTLGSYFDGERPVILVMGYYDCPLLCTTLFNGLAQSLAPLEYDPGEDYQIVVVSFDPKNTHEEAIERKREALATFGREVTPGVQSGWAFHTTTADNARLLADSVGYQFAYRPKIDEYSHAAVIMVMTPDGVLSRYLFGLTFEEKDLRLALLEASDGGIASGVGDYFLQRCFTWDPNSNSYALAAFQLMRVGAVLGAVILGLMIGLLLLAERRRARKRADSNVQTVDTTGLMPMGRH